MVTNTTNTTITIRRGDGREVIFEALPAATRGAPQRSRPIAAALITEAAFVGNDGEQLHAGEIHNSLTPRLLPGGQILLETTPWAMRGFVWQLFSENHGKPQTALVGHGSTSLFFPDKFADVERLRQMNPDTCLREMDACFMAHDAGFLINPVSLDACIDRSAIQPAAGPDARYGFGADFGFVRDSSALCVVRRDGVLLRLVEAIELRPRKNEPLEVSAVVAQLRRSSRVTAAGC